MNNDGQEEEEQDYEGNNSKWKWKRKRKRFHSHTQSRKRSDALCRLNWNHRQKNQLCDFAFVNKRNKRMEAYKIKWWEDDLNSFFLTKPSDTGMYIVHIYKNEWREKEKEAHVHNGMSKMGLKLGSVKNVFVAFDFIYRFISASSILFLCSLLLAASFNRKLSLRARASCFVDTKDWAPVW